eukprot:g2294.t1
MDARNRNVTFGGSKEAEHLQPLLKEAEILAPIFKIWKLKYDKNIINDVDFAAVYIIAYLAIRFPACKFIAGQLKPNITYDKALLRRDCSTLEAFPELVRLLNNDEKLTKYLGQNYLKLKIVHIFSKLRWKGIKKHSNNYVNHSIVQWGIGQRPLLLRFYIPSPTNVLKMQANSSRVITMLIKHEQLVKNHVAPLTYMKGAILHERDPLHFLIHDLQHIEKFCDKLTHEEQVGFFKCMLRLGENEPQSFFEKYDTVNGGDENKDDASTNNITLWQLMEYVVSDMNTWSTHLIKYVRAKWMIYNKANCNDNNNFDKGWDELMVNYFNIPKNSKLYNAVSS